MPKRSTLKVRPTAQEGYRFVVPVPPELNEEKRARRFFVTRKEAQQFADDLQVRRDNFGTRLAQMPERLRHEALECVERLQALSATLTQATDFFIQHKIASGRSCTLADLTTRVVAAKKLAGKSDRYLMDLRRIGSDFARRFPNKLVADVTPDDVEKWVAVPGHGATTRNNRLRTLSSAFSLAVRRKWCESNPVDRIERANARKPVAGYLNAEQAYRLLQHADSDLSPYIAIQLFAGLRPAI